MTRPQDCHDERLRRELLDDVVGKQRIANLRRRVSRARNFPENTCPASRHLHMIADGLLSKHGYPMLQDEPAHCAESILAVLASLWEARTKEANAATPLAQAAQEDDDA